MYQETLQTLGLSPNEAKIYETLLEKGESSIGQIAVDSKVHRRNVYDCIQRLIEKGLCFEIFSKGENHYNAVDPGKLSELIAEKQVRLQAIMPELQKKYLTSAAPQEAYIYRGYEGLKNIWRDIVRVGEPVYTIGAKGQWLDPKLESAKKSFFSELKRKKIKHYLLFDSEIRKELPNFNERLDFIKEYGFLPREYSTNSVINIFGSYVVTYTGTTIGKIKEDTVMFVLRSQELADSYRIWFRYLWKQSEGTGDKSNP